MSWNDHDEPQRFFSDPSRRPRRTGLVVVISVLVAAGTTAALHFTIVAPAQRMRRVPPLVGLPLSEALAVARRTDVRLVVAGSAPDSFVGRGAVATQQPLAGSSVPRGSAVRVVLSDGPTSGVPARSAALSAVDGRPGDAAVAPDDGGLPADEGPRPQPADRGPSVSRQAGRVAVPRVTGVRLSRARSQLQGLGLRVGRVRHRVDEDRMDSVVLDQSPSAGTRVEQGSSVELLVNNTTGR